MSRKFKVTSYAEKELAQFLELKGAGVALPKPLKPEIVITESHEDAAQICKKKKENFLGEPVVIIQTTVME